MTPLKIDSKQSLLNCRSLEAQSIDTADVQRLLAGFEELWQTIQPREQVRLTSLLVDRVEFDGVAGNVGITFHDTGMQSLTPAHGGNRMNKPANHQPIVPRQNTSQRQQELGGWQGTVRAKGRIPRIARLLALAHRCYDLVRDGVIINQSELAHYGQISTTRMSQIMWLDNLAPDIQEQILNLPRTIQGRDAILEREVRPIAKTLDWGEQEKDVGGSATSVPDIVAGDRQT